MAVKAPYTDTRTLTKEIKHKKGIAVQTSAYSYGTTPTLKCCCADCQTSFETDRPKDEDGHYIRDYGLNMYTKEGDIECPECHSFGPILCASKLSPYNYEDIASKSGLSASTLKNREPYVSDSLTVGEYIYVSKDKDKLNKIECNKMRAREIIFPESNKLYEAKSEDSIVYDLKQHKIQVSHIRLKGKERIKGGIFDLEDPFLNKLTEKQAMRYGSSQKAYGIDKKVYFAMTKPGISSDMTVPNEIIPIEDNVIKTIAEGIPHKDPMFEDPKATGLFLKEHKLNSQNKEESEDIKYIYCYMATKYPAVLQYVEEETLERFKDHKYNEQRKLAEDPTYTVKELTESAKNKIFRDEMTLIASQLCAIDDNITTSLSKCNTSDEMKSVLRTYAFGTTDLKKAPEAIKPSGLKHVSDEVLAANTIGSKKLVNMFRQNPLGVANTIYTCRKMKIDDPNHINAIMDLTADTFGITTRTKAERKLHFDDHMKDFGTIAPLRTREMTGYIINFVKSRDTAKAIQELYDTEYIESQTQMKPDPNWRDSPDYDPRIDAPQIRTNMTLKDHEMFLFDGIRGYGNMLKSKMRFNAVTETYQSKKDENTQRKILLRGYLGRGFTVKDAYINFSTLFEKEESPKEAIDNCIRAIKHDIRVEKAIAYEKEHSEEEVRAEFSDVFPESKTLQDLKKEYDEIQSESAVLDTQNGRPLFNRRNIREIHDEIDHMSRSIVDENIVFKYSERDKSMEDEIDYEKPDGTTGKMKMVLLTDSYDCIRQATTLHNCLKSCRYDIKINQHSCRVLKVLDENDRTIGACEIQEHNGGKRYMEQFQTTWDDPMPEEFRAPAVEWFRKHDISYERSNDWARWGKDEHRTTDYHHEEMDEVMNQPVSIEENKKRTSTRLAKAAELYGVDTDGHVDVPDTPDDISNENALFS